MQLPNATLIGLPTNADTRYGDTHWFYLPGGSIFQYTMKAFKNRHRADNQPYLPTYHYTGNIENTPDLMKWVNTLP